MIQVGEKSRGPTDGTMDMDNFIWQIYYIYLTNKFLSEKILTLLFLFLKLWFEKEVLWNLLIVFGCTVIHAYAFSCSPYFYDLLIY